MEETVEDWLLQVKQQGNGLLGQVDLLEVSNADKSHDLEAKAHKEVSKKILLTTM